MFLQPYGAALTAVSAALWRGGFDLAFQVQAATLKTPEAGPLSSARARAGAYRTTLVCHAHLRRRDPHPEKQTVCELASSWTRDASSVAQRREAGIRKRGGACFA